MKTPFIGPALVFVAFLASCSSKEGQERRLVHRKAFAYAKKQDFAKAAALLDSVTQKGDPLIKDSTTYFRSDLAEIIDDNRLVLHAFEIDSADKWQALEKHKFSPSFLQMRSSIIWAGPKLLSIRESWPALRNKLYQDNLRAQIAIEKQLKINAEKEAAQARIEAVQDEKQNFIKRGQIEKTLRESFLDKELDIKVKVSGKQRKRITLSYVLMNDVWSYKMNQAGNVDELLDLGFDEVVLTDGYDYKVTWRREHEK